jgi:NADPH:quinone reductase-like Zn-dependent oxidoreductase
MNEIPNVMKGIQLTGHGGLDKLVFRDDIPVPTPGPRDVLIKVCAAGVNNTDLNTRLGWYSKSNGDSSDASWSGNAIQFPRIQGADVCGKVVAVGDQVDASRIDERVLVEP